MSKNENDQPVTLANFTDLVKVDASHGSGWQSTLACILLVLVYADCLMMLQGVSPIEAALVSRLSGQAAGGGVVTIILGIQVLVLLWGISALGRSTMGVLVAPGLGELASFGVGFAGTVRSALICRGLVFMAVTVVFYAAFSGVPSLETASAAGNALRSVMTLLAPPVTAWILTLLAFRAMTDRSILVGLVAALVILVVASVAADGGGADANVAPGRSFHPKLLEAAWFRLVELTLVWVIIGALIFTIVSNPFQVKVFKLTGTDVEKSNLCVSYTPFGSLNRTPHKLMFELGNARVLVLSRLYNAPVYELVNSFDDHLQLSIHDRSLKLWNITGFMARIPAVIQVSDSAQYFAIRIALGKLSTASATSSQKATLPVAAVDLATDLLIANTDLVGLFTRALANAFEAHTRAARGEIDVVRRLLARAPSPLTAEFPLSSATYLDQFNDAAKQYEALRDACNRYLNELYKAQEDFDAATKEVADWRNFGGNSGVSEEGKGQDRQWSLEEAWFNSILGEFAGLSAQPLMTEVGGCMLHIHESVQVLRMLGLRFNDVQLSEGSVVAQCKQGLVEMRTRLEDEVRVYKQRLDDVRDQRRRFEEQVILTAIDKPGVLTSRTLEAALNTARGGAALTQLSLEPNLGKADDDAAAV